MLSGCVQSHRAPVVYYSPPGSLSPTSQSPDVRVYSGAVPPPPVNAQPVPSVVAPAPVADPDVALAQSLSQLLKGDPGLAAISSKVSATVHHGVVTLRGSVPTENDRQEIKDRVSKLSGVAAVEDNLGIDLR